MVVLKKNKWKSKTTNKQRHQNWESKLIEPEQIPHWGGERIRCSQAIRCSRTLLLKKKNRKCMIDSSKKMWTDKWCNDIFSCKIWDWTTFNAGRNKKKVQLVRVVDHEQCTRPIILQPDRETVGSQACYEPDPLLCLFASVCCCVLSQACCIKLWRSP